MPTTRTSTAKAPKASSTAKATVKAASPKAAPTASVKVSSSIAHLDELRHAFAALTPSEQRVLLAEWNQSIQSLGNPVTALVEFVQKEFGANPTTEVWTEGASHVPVVYCKLIMPDGTEYIASGKNQKIAKQLAAEEALRDLQKHA